MRRTELLQEIRMMRFEEACGAWTQGRLTQEETACLLGVHELTFRRHIDRYEEAGLDALPGRPPPTSGSPAGTGTSSSPSTMPLPSIIRWPSLRKRGPIPASRACMRSSPTRACLPASIPTAPAITGTPPRPGARSTNIISPSLAEPCSSSASK